jgi:hypothetical protein
MVQPILGGFRMRLANIAIQAVALAALSTSLSGCLATAAVGAVGAVASTAVGVTGKAVGETIHVGHVAVDSVTGAGGDKKAPGKGD